MKLSILIPSLEDRFASRIHLLNAIYHQEGGNRNDIEILSDIDSGEKTIGKKRNDLMDKATGEYICFIDDDDAISKDYISKIFSALKSNPDCCSLLGVYTADGDNPELFEHSIKYSEYKTNPPTKGIRYERYPNHLNVIKSSIAKQFKFPEINHGEDTDYATQIFKSGLLKIEAKIEGVIYHYQYKRK